jgi:flagellar hook-associated protein 2
MTLENIETIFNSVSGDTGITASIVSVAPGEYKLEFTSTGYGVQAAFDLNNINTIKEDNSGVFQNVTRTTTSAPALTSPRVSVLEASTSPSGVLLKGASGSVYEGLELIYAAGGNAAVNINMTQGLGDRVFNALNQITDTNGGFLTVTLDQLVADTARNVQEISKIDEQLVTYRLQLEAQYTALEAALTKANNLLTLLDAQARARSD